MLDPTPNMRRLAEAELLRAELEARRLARRAAWIGVGALLAAIAIVMLVLAVYLALAEAYGATRSAAIVGGSLALLAGLAIVVGGGGQRGRAARLELELANRTVEEARREVRRDFDLVEKRLDELSMGVLSLLKGSTANLPILTLVLGALAAMSPALRRILMPFLRKD